MLLNEIEPYAADWLRALFPGAVVDQRSIVDLDGASLARHARAHFFAGIGGWEYALRLAGWPEDAPVWTGSCPCQPLSSARRGRGSHPDLWPAWRAHIAASRPRTVFGEQVASARGWCDQVCADLEALGYAVGTAVLPACAVGLDHARARFYFVGHTDSEGESSLPLDGQMDRLPRHRGQSERVGTTHGLSARASQLRAYGNAVVVPLAAEFVMAYMESRAVLAGEGAR